MLEITQEVRNDIGRVIALARQNPLNIFAMHPLKVSEQLNLQTLYLGNFRIVYGHEVMPDQQLSEHLSIGKTDNTLVTLEEMIILADAYGIGPLEGWSMHVVPVPPLMAGHVFKMIASENETMH
jgi:hypothetical protein